MKWVSVVVAAIVCAVGAASWSLAASPSGVGVGSPRAVRDFEVRLVPPVKGGWVGWCSSFRTAEGSSSGCPVVPTPGSAIFDESWSGHAPPPVTVGAALTTSRVAAVSVNNGTPIPTRAESTLPHGFRAVMVEIPGQEERQVQPGAGSSPGCPSGSGSREAPEHCFAALPEYSFTPLDAKGAPLPRHEPSPLKFGLPSEFWKRPGHPPRGVCRIAAEHLRGLSAQWGHVVVTSIHGYPGIIGRAFLSCADTEYYLDNWPLDAGVLLDARHPGTRPAPLPDMKAVPRHPGVFAAPGDGGMLVGRRVGNAWLVVDGGNGVQQRLEVLARIHATAHP